MKSAGKPPVKAPNVLSIEKEIVMNEWGLPHDSYPECGIEVIEDTIAGTGRWSILHKLIVKINDKYYQTRYSVGATEQQDESPWEYQDKVEFEEVQQVEKIIKVWEVVP